MVLPILSLESYSQETMNCSNGFWYVKTMKKFSVFVEYCTTIFCACVCCMHLHTHLLNHEFICGLCLLWATNLHIVSHPLSLDSITEMQKQTECPVQMHGFYRPVYLYFFYDVGIFCTPKILAFLDWSGICSVFNFWVFWDMCKSCNLTLL